MRILAKYSKEFTQNSIAGHACFAKSADALDNAIILRQMGPKLHSFVVHAFIAFGEGAFNRDGVDRVTLADVIAYGHVIVADDRRSQGRASFFANVPVSIIRPKRMLEICADLDDDTPLFVQHKVDGPGDGDDSLTLLAEAASDDGCYQKFTELLEHTGLMYWPNIAVRACIPETNSLED